MDALTNPHSQVVISLQEEMEKKLVSGDLKINGVKIKDLTEEPTPEQVQALFGGVVAHKIISVKEDAIREFLYNHPQNTVELHYCVAPENVLKNFLKEGMEELNKNEKASAALEKFNDLITRHFNARVMMLDDESKPSISAHRLGTVFWIRSKN